MLLISFILGNVGMFSVGIGFLVQVFAHIQRSKDNGGYKLIGIAVNLYFIGAVIYLARTIVNSFSNDLYSATLSIITFVVVVITVAIISGILLPNWPKLSNSQRKEAAMKAESDRVDQEIIDELMRDYPNHTTSDKLS